MQLARVIGTVVVNAQGREPRQCHAAAGPAAEPLSANRSAARWSRSTRSAPASARTCSSSAARKRAFRSIRASRRSMPGSSASSITGAWKPDADRARRGHGRRDPEAPEVRGAKLLLVQPLNLDDTPRGGAFLAVDGVGAGVHEKVLVVLEGRAAGEALGKKGAPVDAAVIGIVDAVDVDGTSLSRNSATMVRDAIARQGRAGVRGTRLRRPRACAPHASHGKLTLVTGGDSEGQCIIEPSVRCNHCGYCLSLGH